MAPDQSAENLDLVITRVFDAPRERVWKAWTDAEDMKYWSSPCGFAIPVSEGDLKAGGYWKAVMVKPDGTRLPLGGTYREIVPPGKLVFTHAWLDESDRPTSPETVCTVLLESRGDKTRMTFRQTGFTSSESQKGHEGGWSESFDKLADLLV